jgi:hypothetical protein
VTTAEFYELILKAVKAELETAQRLAASLKVEEERDNWRAYAERLSKQLDEARARAKIDAVLAKHDGGDK